MLRLKTWILPFALLSVMGVSIQYLSLVFTDKVRWVFLILLGLQGLFNGLKKGNRPGIFLVLYLYLTWCLSTTFWSEVPELSFAKVLALMLVVFSMVLAGKSWVEQRGVDDTFGYLMPMSLAALAVAILGYFFSPFRYDGYLFQGFAYGSNMFGALMAMSLPWSLWCSYIYRAIPRWRFFWMGLPVLTVVFILMSQSRASLLIAIFAIAGFMLAQSRRQRFFSLFSLLFVITLIFSFRPELFQSSVKQVVYKHGDEILATRQQSWEESLNAAELGGWMGAGYGVSIGSGSWQGGLSAVGYGREKGNSQLAIIEETGVIGLVFYLFVILSVSVLAGKAFIGSHVPQTRVAIGIAFGTWIGLHVQSVFEGWWGAPGSPESFYFWALTGVLLGLAAKVNEESSGRLNFSLGKGRNVTA